MAEELGESYYDNLIDKTTEVQFLSRDVDDIAHRLHAGDVFEEEGTLVDKVSQLVVLVKELETLIEESE
jgi:hypothetical protein